MSDSAEFNSSAQLQPQAEYTHEKRKADHIRINLDEDVSFKAITTGLEKYYFMHRALPELNLAEIDISAEFLGHSLTTPILISSMTGGTSGAKRLNLMLAEAAQEVGIAMGIGSQRAAIEDETLAASYEVRSAAPDILLFANVGAVQLNYGYGIDQCKRAVEMLQADALILHFNALQEAVQPEGDDDFSDLYRKVEAVCRGVGVPVIAKEVGWGFAADDARRLAQCGVAAIDVAGAGGTSWSQVEMHRAPTARHARVAGAFLDWGIPTSDSIQYCREGAPQLPVIASGGIKTGIDIAKCISLGANLGGLAGDFLKAVDADGVAGAVELAGAISDELRVAMFCAGVPTLEKLAQTPLYVR